MIKLGVIGLGHMGNYHTSVCAKMSDIELVAIADPNEECFKKVKSTKVIKTTDYRRWLDLVDGVIIAVPTDHHFEVARACITQSKHVLIEKPLTKTIEQAQTLFELAAQHNVALHVGHVERFNGAVQELKKIINSPYLIESHRMGPFSPRVQNDTVILDLMIHDLDIILSLANSPVKSISVNGSTVKSKLTDIAHVQLEFENGVLANIISSRAAHIKRRTMTVHQKNAYLHLDFTAQNIEIHRNASQSIKVGSEELKYKQGETVERLFVYKENPLKLEIEHFVKSIKTGKNRLNPEQDLEALHLTLEIEKRITSINEQNYDRYYSRNRKPSHPSM